MNERSESRQPNIDQVREEEKGAEIGPTALIVLDAKNIPPDCGGLIPYADKLAQLTHADLATQEYMGIDFRNLTEEEKSSALGAMVPMMQGRYLSVHEAIMDSGISEVVEIAPGVGPRGYQLTDGEVMGGGSKKISWSRS